MNTAPQNQYDLNTQSGRIVYVRSYILNMLKPDFCRLTGIPYASMLYWETNKEKKISYKNAKRFVEALEHIDVICSIEWILNGVGDMPYKIQSSPLSTIPLKAHKLQPNDTDYESMQEADALRRLMKNPSFYIQPDDSMLPLFKEGDILIGEKYYNEDISLYCLNQECIVQTPQLIRLLRRVSKGNRENTYFLSPINPLFTEETIESPLEFAAPILWHKHNKRNSTHD